MKTVILAAIRCSLMFTAVTGSLVSVKPAQAYTVRLQQIGANVVANGSGAINLTGLNFLSSSAAFPNLLPAGALIVTGPTTFSAVDVYLGLTGPTSFGSGFTTFANSGSGDTVGVLSFLLLVPQGYVSGTALSDSATYNNATFASLGLTPGTYVWTWGDGANQRFTLRIGAVPDGGSTVSLLGCALLGLAALRRKLSC